MPKPSTTLAGPALFKVLAGAMVVLLLTSSWGRAQEPVSPASTTSVEPGTEHIGPGCAACGHVYTALHAVAEWILPKEERASTYEIAPYETALRYSKVRGNRPDVTLSAKIVHRRGFDQPVDECEMRCLREMKEHLSDVGACPHRWSLLMAPRA